MAQRFASHSRARKSSRSRSRAARPSALPDDNLTIRGWDEESGFNQASALARAVTRRCAFHGPLTTIALLGVHTVSTVVRLERFAIQIGVDRVIVSGLNALATLAAIRTERG